MTCPLWPYGYVDASLWGIVMVEDTRNHTVAGIGLLIGSAVSAFGASQAWVSLGATAPLGQNAGLGGHLSLGFDHFRTPSGDSGNLKPLLIGGAVALAVLALLLFATRIPGLGLLWRLVALMIAGLLGLTAAAGWGVINDPASVIADPESSAGPIIGLGLSIAEFFGAASVEPGLGLWLLTVGAGVAAIGALIPATRGRNVVTPSAPVAAFQSPNPGPKPAGWYPDQMDGRFVRFFDGARWTDAVRPRG
jgi:hypothetical protein